MEVYFFQFLSFYIILKKSHKISQKNHKIQKLKKNTFILLKLKKKMKLYSRLKFCHTFFFKYFFLKLSFSTFSIFTYMKNVLFTWLYIYIFFLANSFHFVFFNKMVKKNERLNFFYYMV